TGVLLVNDERGETVCEFYFENGTPRWGRFQQLLGNEAFWQLFIQPRKGWTFSFSRELPTNVAWTEEKIITGSADEMLIRAIQMRRGCLGNSWVRRGVLRNHIDDAG